MPVIVNGTSKQVLTNGKMRTVALVNGRNRLGAPGPGGITLGFDNFTVEYEITSAGFVSLAATVTSDGTQAMIDTTVTDFPAGYTFDEVGVDTPRPNNIGIIVPADYANEGDTVLGQVTAIQSGISEPIVVTNNAESTHSSATLSGTITSTGDTAIDTFGFYFREGRYTTHAEVRLGTNIPASTLDATNTFTSSRSVFPSTAYTYYAYATNLTPLTGVGDVEVFTSAAPPVVQAEADYEFYNIGPPTGGTLFSSTTGAYGDWSGGTNILPDDENPTSARCGADDETCTLTRERTRTDVYTGATQARGEICTIIVQGAGTPRCSNPDNPVGATIPATSTTSNRIDEVIEDESIVVTNAAFEQPLDPFAKANVTVTFCNVTAGGSATVILSVGTASNISSVDANTSTDEQTVTVTFDASGIVPEGYSDSGQSFGGEPGSQFNGYSIQCTQAGAADLKPVFSANSASVVALAGGTFSASAIADDSTVVVTRGVTSYFLSAPTGEGGTITGPSGIQALSPGSVTHTWTIAMNSAGPEVDYKITVRQFN